MKKLHHYPQTDISRICLFPLGGRKCPSKLSDELLELERQQAELRITLSYFVDPNPSKRGWNSKYRYPSFGLRFSLKGASETDEEFLSRVNLAERGIDVDVHAELTHLRQ